MTAAERGPAVAAGAFALLLAAGLCLALWARVDGPGGLGAGPAAAAFALAWLAALTGVRPVAFTPSSRRARARGAAHNGAPSRWTSSS